MSETKTTGSKMADSLTPARSPLAGAVTWFEIGTPDPEEAQRFYAEAFGWTFDVQGPYTFVRTGADHPLAGGIADTTTTPPGTPATYAVPYVQVDDVAVACRRVEALGGRVIVPATTVPDGLVFAHVADPAGAHLGLWTPPAA